MKLIKEFKEFAVKGNMVDIAIGLIIGASFNKVVDVLVKDVFLPPLAFLTNGMNWENRKLILQESITENGSLKVEEIAIGYGKLFEVVVDFLVVGITVFIVLKFINVIRNKAEDPKDETITTPKEIELLNNVTELLQKQNEILERKK